EGRGSYSIDQQRYNFQFGGDAFWDIKGGKVGAMVADVAYQSRTPDFWQACDALGDQSTWRNVGLNRDGKGEPGQINAMSHGCPAEDARRARRQERHARRARCGAGPAPTPAAPPGAQNLESGGRPRAPGAAPAGTAMPLGAVAGPVYRRYKALAAVKLAACLS